MVAGEKARLRRDAKKYISLGFQSDAESRTRVAVGCSLAMSSWGQ